MIKFPLKKQVVLPGDQTALSAMRRAAKTDLGWARAKLQARGPEKMSRVIGLWLFLAENTQEKLVECDK
jgi:hypothetical protein